MNVKVIVSARKIIVEILVHVFVRIVSTKKVFLILQRPIVMKLLWILYQQKRQILLQQK